MICGNCGHEYPDRVGFGSVCDKCCSWLHTCRNCSLFLRDSGGCRSLTTEYTGPADEKNFCEEFSPASNPSEPDGQPGAAERFDRLFGEGGG
jgi:hypothetical protein